MKLRTQDRGGFDIPAHEKVVLRMAKKFGQIFFRIWTAATIAWMLCGAIIFIKQADEKISEHQQRLQKYTDELLWLDNQCIVMPEKLDRQEKLDRTKESSANSSLNAMLSLLDERFEETGPWPTWKLQNARQLLEDCQSSDRTTKLRNQAVSRAGLERAWSGSSGKEILINFRPEPMGYIEAFMLTDQFGEGILVFLVAPLVVLYFGYAVRMFWISRLESFIRGGWSAASRNTRLVMFWITVWLVFYPLAVFFFQPSFLDSSENPERIFFGGWIFLPSILGIVWVGYRKLFGKETLNH